jgi:hypothetical protein
MACCREWAAADDGRPCENLEQDAVALGHEAVIPLVHRSEPNPWALDGDLGIRHRWAPGTARPARALEQVAPLDLRQTGGLQQRLLGRRLATLRPLVGLAEVFKRIIRATEVMKKFLARTVVRASTATETVVVVARVAAPIEPLLLVATLAVTQPSSVRPRQTCSGISGTCSCWPRYASSKSPCATSSELPR